MLADRSPETEAIQPAVSSRTEAEPIPQIDKEEESKADPLEDRWETLLLFQTGGPEGTSTLPREIETEVSLQDKITLK
jgi:hypothetical protein